MFTLNSRYLLLLSRDQAIITAATFFQFLLRHRYLLWSHWLSLRSPSTPHGSVSASQAGVLWLFVKIISIRWPRVQNHHFSTTSMSRDAGDGLSGQGRQYSVCVFNKLNVRQGNIWDDPSPAALWASYKHKQMTWTWWSQPTLAIMETRNILTREKKTMHRLSVVSLFMPRSGVRCSFRCSCL